MEILSAIFQGIIQGITEFLPISSSGHLAIYQHLTGQSGEAGLLLSVLLHLGTLLAVCIVYRKTIFALIIEFFAMIKDIFTGKFKWSEMNTERRMIIMMIISSAMLIPIVLPIFGGNSLVDFLMPVESGEHIWVVGLMLLITAALMFVSYSITTSKRLVVKHQATVKDAIFIGITQALAALFPGLSRSGSTTATALICGLDKKYATRYSFILSIPAVLAANIFSLKDAVETNADINVIAAIAGIITAAVVGIIAIKLFLWMVKKNSYIVFSYYCAAMGILVLIISMF